MQREKDCHIKNKTFGNTVSEELLKGEKAVPADWVFKIKHRGGPINSNQLSDKQYKARVVIRGQFMKQGVNFNDTFAPVAKSTTLRAVFALAAKYKCLLYSGDVETAFLTADMDCQVFVRMPPYWGKNNNNITSYDTTSEIRILLKGVPGIPQGSRLFHQTFSDHLISMGYKPSDADKCLFINPTLSEKNAVVIWVDDFVYMCEEEITKDEFIRQIRQRFTVNDFYPLRTFLGMEVVRDIQACTIKLRQFNTIRVLLERAKMEDCNSTSTPTISGATFTKADCPPDAATNTTITEYRSLVALLNFIACWTRPDITFVVNKLCKFMANPGDTHWKQLKHLIRYVAGTQEWGLNFDMGKQRENTVKGYSDSSFGDCPDTGRSTLAYLFLYHGALISWYSKLNGYVTLSTNHSEYAALAVAAREAEWLILLFKDLDRSQPVMPVPILVDNSGVVSLVFNPVDHQANKHVKLACHYARELTEAKFILPKKVASEDNLADLFTKPLPTTTFKKLATQLISPCVKTEQILFMRASAYSNNSVDNPDSEDTNSDSEANMYYSACRNYNGGPESTLLAQISQDSARTKQTSRSQFKHSNPAADSEETKAPQQNVMAQTTKANREAECTTQEQEAAQIDEEERRSVASKLIAQIPPASAGTISLQPPSPLLYCLGCGIYNSQSYTQLCCSLCQGKNFNWSCACVVDNEEVSIARPRQARRPRMRKQYRSYTPSICYMAPGAKGSFFHMATCPQRPVGGVYGSIEFAYAVKMVPSICCKDPSFEEGC
jgi:hypothetical protein